MTQTITAYLEADHERLHTLLCSAMGDEPFNAEAFAAFRAGLLRHIAIEERVLFPAVRRARGGEPLPAAHALRVEHAALTSLLVPTPNAALCREIESLLTAHDAKEEGPHGVYAQCDAALSPQESIALGEKAASYRAIPLAPHYDGPGTYRTAAAALASAQRLKRRRSPT